MTKNKFVPDFTLTSQEGQDQFIYWAYNVFHKVSPDEYSNPYYMGWMVGPRHRFSKDKIPQKDILFLQELYREGFFVYQVLFCSFDEFLFAITQKRGAYPLKLRREFWYTLHHTDFRKPLKYQKQSHHKPKEDNDLSKSKREWREKKGFDKDYRRQNRSWAGGRKTAAKRTSNRCYRRWEAQTLSKGNYDDFYQSKDRHFFNERDWD